MDGHEQGWRWSALDEVDRPHYRYLPEDDSIYWYLIRTSGNYTVSDGNSIVSNFQKDVEKYHDRPEVMKYKDEAIAFFARQIRRLVKPGPRSIPIVLIPMITSRPKTDQWHDDRLARACTLAAELLDGAAVVHDVLDVDQRLRKAKSGGPRTPEEIGMHIIAYGQRHPETSVVLLVDDVLTLGGHYAACRDAVRPLYPNAQTAGVFLAKHVPDEPPDSHYEFMTIGQQ